MRYGCAMGVLMLVGCAASERDARPAEALALDLAEVLVEHRSYDTAVPLLQQGIAADPNNPRLHRLLGVVLRDKGQLGEAHKELAKALALAPDDAATYAAIGMTYDLEGNSATAEPYHRKAVGLAPNAARYQNNLGYCLFLQGKAADALAVYQAGLRLDPTERRLYNNLGFAQAATGDFESAAKSFAQGGDAAAALMNLGLAYELAGKMDKAHGLYLEALNNDRARALPRQELMNFMNRTSAERYQDSVAPAAGVDEP